MIKKAKIISVIIPVRNEVQNITKLFTEIEQSLRGHVWELIWIDDASTDNTKQILCRIYNEHKDKKKYALFSFNIWYSAPHRTVKQFLNFL